MANFGIWEDREDGLPLLRVQYDSDNPEFARGVQVGMIWQLLFSEVEEFEMPVYASNTEMLMRMAEAAGYEFTARYESDNPDGMDYDWLLVTFKTHAK